MTGSTAASYLEDRGIAFQGVGAIDEAFALLEGGSVDAVVYDSPVLLYYALGEGRGKVQVVGNLFERQYYGIALPQDSPLREEINRTLLAINEDGTYNRIHQRWFGAPPVSTRPGKRRVPRSL